MRRALVQVALLATPIFASLQKPVTAAPGERSLPEGVEIKVENGQTLAGTFYKPASGKAPAVVLVHDAGADRSQLKTLADLLSKQGFGVLIFDLRGHGASKSAELDWSKLSDGDKQAAWSSAAADVDAAARWILEQPTILRTNLSLVGYGAGCALAVRHAKKDENIVCMALLAPRIDNYGIDLRADIQTLQSLPTFVVATKDDEAEHMALEAKASAGSPDVEVLVAQDKVTPLEDKKVPGKVVNWVNEKAMPKKGNAPARKR